MNKFIGVVVLIALLLIATDVFGKGSGSSSSSSSSSRSYSPAPAPSRSYNVAPSAPKPATPPPAPRPATPPPKPAQAAAPKPAPAPVQNASRSANTAPSTVPPAPIAPNQPGWFDRNFPWLVALWATSSSSHAQPAPPAAKPAEVPCKPDVPLEQQKGCVQAPAPKVAESKPVPQQPAEKAMVMKQEKSSGSQPRSTW